MRQYQAPFLLDEEPRLVGGKFTLRQGAYVLAGAATSFVILNKTFAKSPAMAAACILCDLLLASFLAFYKVGDTGLHIDKYLFRLWLFNRRSRGYTYSRGKGAMGC